jgi:nitrite reductase (NADH) small subunit
MSSGATQHALGPVAAIPLGEARVFRVEGRDVAVVRCRSGEVYAVGAECPHRGGPLADGLVGNGSVICPLHGFAFDLRTGEAKGHTCERLATYHVEVSSFGAMTIEI